jgi:hypothetical protein
LSFKDQKFIEEALTTFAEDTHEANMIEDGVALQTQAMA